MTPPPDPTPPVATPVMMTDTYVEVSAANLKCLCTSVSIEPENKPIEVTTFCGVQDYPGPVKWHFKATFLQSFDSGATDEILGTALADYEADGSLLSFSVRPYSSRPESATNPTFSGQAIPQPYTIFGGDAGTASEVDIDWIMVEPPTRTPPLTISQAARVEPAEAEPVSSAA